MAKKGTFLTIWKIIQSSSLAFLGIVPVKTDGIQAIAMQTKTLATSANVYDQLFLYFPVADISSTNIFNAV